MGAAVLYITESIVSMGNCITCGVAIAGPETFNNQRLRDHKAFYCVNGHSQVYVGKTKEQALQEQLDAEKARRVRAEEGRVRDAEHAKRQVAAERGKVTKLRNRVGNGVCPCCNRTFQNLLMHMTTQHPDFKEPES